MIYVDLDSTLNNFIEAWVHYMNKVENKDYTLDDIKTWNSPYILYTKNDEFFDKSFSIPIVKPFPNAKWLLFNLKEFDDITILSHTSNENTEIKKQWVEKYFKGYKYIFTTDCKSNFCFNENDILIDDNFINIHNFVHKGGYGILFRNNGKYRYNDYIWRRDKYFVANNYEEIVDIVKKIKGS
jgi:5'(3')-deoxyribonucleotidase